MSDTSETILAAGIAASVLLISLAIVDHINRAETIEVSTPHYAVRSNHYPMI